MSEDKDKAKNDKAKKTAGTELEAVTDALAGTWVGAENEEFGRELTRTEASEMADAVLKALAPVLAARDQAAFDRGWDACESHVAARSE